MNLPNKLTVIRIILTPIFTVFLVIDNLFTGYLALVTFCIAALTDLYDGYIARQTGVVTSFGKFMDPLADKFLISMSFIAFISLEYVEPWIVLTIIGREFVITGLRTLAAYKGYVIVSNTAAKCKTAFQMIVILLILIYYNLKTTVIAFGNNWSIMLDAWMYIFLNSLLFITMVLTLITGLDYLFRNRGIIKGI